MLLLLACTSPPIDPSGPHVPADPGAPDTAPEHLLDAPVDTGTPGFEHLPVLIIDAAGPIAADTKSDATLEVIEAQDGTLTDLDAAPRAFEGPIGIEVHGSSSTGYPKLGYRFECRDEAGEDDNCALAGMPEGSDWVLHAPYSDKTLVRNAFAYGVGRDAAAAAGRWEPRAQLVEVVLDGDYVGVYLLVERVSREDDRLAIPPTTDAKDGSVDGGFIVKVDQHRSAGFDTAAGTPIDWAEPKTGEVTAAEASYLLGWFDGMEAVLAGPGFADPDTGYAAWLDVDAWIDHWLVNELTHNIDAYRLSAYLWVDGPPGASKLRAGPLWDFDRALGNCNYCETWLTQGWIYDSLDRCGYAYQFPTWWERLREDPAFQQRLRARWEELRGDIVSDAALSARIAAFREELAEAEPRDHARWPVIGTSVDPNWYVGTSYADEIAWLEEWILARAAWMDAHVGE